MINIYEKAYTEVVEILNCLPEEEFHKIPKEKIEYYKENMDKDYKWSIDLQKALSEQNISDEANAILISLFRDYFATEKQKKTLYSLLNQNQEKIENIKREKYSPDNIFGKNNKNSIVDNSEK